MRSPIGVDSKNVRAVLADNPDLLRPDDEFVNIWKIHHPGKPVRSSAGIHRIRKHARPNTFDVLPIPRFPLVVVRRALANPRFARSPVGRLDGGRVEDRRADHLPDSSPVWKLSRRTLRQHAFHSPKSAHTEKDQHQLPGSCLPHAHTFHDEFESKLISRIGPSTRLAVNSPRLTCLLLQFSHGLRFSILIHSRDRTSYEPNLRPAPEETR